MNINCANFLNQKTLYYPQNPQFFELKWIFFCFTKIKWKVFQIQKNISDQLDITKKNKRTFLKRSLSRYYSQRSREERRSQVHSSRSAVRLRCTRLPHLPLCGLESRASTLHSPSGQARLSTAFALTHRFGAYLGTFFGFKLYSLSKDVGRTARCFLGFWGN